MDDKDKRIEALRAALQQVCRAGGDLASQVAYAALVADEKAAGGDVTTSVPQATYSLYDPIGSVLPGCIEEKP
jgi:hypothetical protein